MAAKKGGLGRGLDALFADAAPVVKEKDTNDAITPATTSTNKTIQKKNSGNLAKSNPARDTNKSTDPQDTVVYININSIKPNVDQPRKNFNKQRLEELANSIKENGVIQPLIVRDTNKGYELVAGERRWRASRIAGVKEVPCLIRNFDEKQNAVVAIVENMQREDLDAIEEAEGIQSMIKKHGFTQEQVSASLGKSRAYIANSMRLLKLPGEIRQMIVDNSISAAHGRTLLGLSEQKNQMEIAERIRKEGLSVRATESLVNKLKDEKKPNRKRRKSNKPTKSNDICAVEKELQTLLGTKVTIKGSSSTGKLEIEYYSLDELNRIIETLRESF